MKKIATVIGVLVLGWLGATAYISSALKGELDHYIESVNALYASEGVHYKAEVKSSFFTSDVTLEVHLDKERFGKAITDLYAELIKLPIAVEFKAEHGPIFYRDGLGIGFAKFTGQMKASELLDEALKEDLLKAMPEDITLHHTEVLCFDKTLKITLHSNALTLADDDEKLEIAPLVGSGVVDTQTLLGALDITLPKIAVEGKGNTAMIKDTTLHIDMKERFGGKYLLGDVAFKIAKVSMELEELPKPVEMDFAVNIKTEREEDDFLAAAITMQLNQEGFEQLQLTAEDMARQVNFSMRLDGLSPEVLKRLEEIGQKQQQMADAVFSMFIQMDPDEAEAVLKQAEAAQEDFMHLTTEALKALLVKERTTISAALDFTTKENAKSKMRFSAGYVGETLQGELEEMVAYLLTKPLEYLALEVDLNINEKHFALIQSPQEQQQAKMGFELAVMQGMMRFENGAYSTHLEYKPKTLKINGKDKTQEILPILKMLEQGR